MNAYITRALHNTSNKVERFFVESPSAQAAAMRSARSIAHTWNDALGREIFTVRGTDKGADVIGRRDTVAVTVTAHLDENDSRSAAAITGDHFNN